MIDALDIALRLIGAFYVFAGVVAARQVVQSNMLDYAIAAISGDKPARAEWLRSVWLAVGALLVLAGGAALLLRMDVAAPLFVLSALGQALYITVLAPFYFDKAEREADAERARRREATLATEGEGEGRSEGEDVAEVGPPFDLSTLEKAGRRQTINAFVIYLAATALVVWAYAMKRLWPWAAFPLETRAAAAAGVVLFAAFIAYQLARPLGSNTRDGATGPGDND